MKSLSPSEQITARVLIACTLIVELLSFSVNAQTTVTLPPICATCGASPEPAAVTLWKQSNSLCSNAIISVNGCATVVGATLNDDPATSPGIEYDWSSANSTTLGVGFGSTSNTRALVEIGGQCWARYDMNIPSGIGRNSSDWELQGTASTIFYMYTFYAAMNSLSPKERGQGVCPAGFHVPSDCEWQYLENTLEMAINEQISTGDSKRKTTIPLANSGFQFTPNVYLGQFNENAGFTSASYYWTSTAFAYIPNWEDPSRVFPYPYAVWRDVNISNTTNLIRRNWAGAGNSGIGVQVPVRCVRD